MPRPSSEFAALVSDLHARIARVVEAAHQHGRAQALTEIRSLVGSGTPMNRGPGRPRGSKNKPKAAAAMKPRKRRRNSWAGLTPAERLARVNAIRKGTGLPPRSA